MLTVGAFTPSHWAIRLGRTGSSSVAMQKIVSR
jgi:hypothetical protein